MGILTCAKILEDEVETDIEISVCYNDKEVKKAISFYLLRICDMRTFAFIMYATLLIAIIFTIIVSGLALLSIIFIISGYIIFYIYYQRPIDGYLKIHKKRKDVLFRFCNDKICMTQKEAISECQWLFFKNVYDIPSAFLLVDANKFIYIVPKICIHEKATTEQLRSLLTEKYPDLKEFK